jgi:recombination protein RecA
LTGGLSKSNTVAIFINQLREKIGVMYGCFNYSSRVVLADGTTEKIGKIVTQKLPVEVLSYDAKTGAMVPKRVVNWFNNGHTDEFLQITVAKPMKNGRAQFGCTSNHLIRTPGGWVEAGKLKVGDRVLEALPHYLSSFQWEVLRGTLMGDGAISPTRSGHGARFRYCHGESQTEYADWKASLFANIGSSRFVREDKVVTYDFHPLPELAEMRQGVYVDGKKVLDDDYLKALSPLSLALWYLDDGNLSIRSKGLQQRTEGLTGRISICVEAMEEATRTRLVNYLADTWGIHTKLISGGKSQTAVVVFDNAESAKFQALIAPYVHPSMEHKLLARFQGQFAVEPEFVPMSYQLVPMPVVDVRVKPKTRSMNRFDIEVEDSHNYLVDGVMVHNSPEVTPGGRALKFYSSVRLDIRRIESIKDGTDVVGNRTRVKVVKNKCAAPFRQAEFDIMYGQGISREGSVLDVGVELGFVKKAGAWFTYEGEQMGQGRENVKTFLRENPQTMAKIDERVRAHLAESLIPDVVGVADGLDIDAPLSLD